MPNRTSIALVTAFALCPASALAQQHRPHHPHHPSTPAAPRPTTPVVVVPSGATEATPGPRPNLDLGEVIPEPVSAVDGMLRRQRVYLFAAPAGASAYGLGALGAGRRLWALLPSCRATNPDDDREPCPVDRVTIEAVMRGNVNAGTPTYIGGVTDARRVQSFVVQDNSARVRIRVLGPANRVRYEAVVEAERLVDLSPPEGAPGGDGFAFDLTRYPAR